MFNKKLLVIILGLILSISCNGEIKGVTPQNDEVAQK